MNYSICLVTEEPIPFEYRFSLTCRLAEVSGKEMEVHLISMSRNPSFTIPNVHFHPVYIKKTNMYSLKTRLQSNIKLIRKIIYVCRSHRVDLIHGWWLAVGFGAFLCKKPFSIDMPEFIEQMYRSYKKPFIRVMGWILKTYQVLIARKSKAIIVESEEAKEEWVKRGIQPEHIYVFPYGIETEFFGHISSDNIRKYYGIPEQKIVVMYHGDIGADDGVDILLKAAQGLGVCTMIIGSAPPGYMRYLRSIAGKDVIFTGWIPYERIPSYLSICDIYVAPFRSSHYTDTTSPLKQMESMSAGKSTICSRIQSFSKYVKNGYDIRFVKPGDVEDLRQVIIELASDESQRFLLGTHARETAKKNFDWHYRVEFEKDILMTLLRRLKG